MSTNNTTAFPETINGVRAFFNSIPSQTDKLRYVLGRLTKPIAPRLAEATVVNCVDTEHYEWDHSKLTEIGLNVFASGDLRQYANTLEANAENMLKEIYFYHFRMLPNAHCINEKFCPGNPEANRFGNTRFATYAEGKAMLTECFNWDINQGRPQDGKCPSILIGHALHNDTGGLEETIGFDPYASGTVVATLDTQQMAREMGIYNPAGSRHEIGLRDLCYHFKIPYRDSHTASNDAAYTIISAIYMALYGRDMPKTGKTVLHSIEAVEATSRMYSNARFGISRYCTRCHRTNHFKKDCHARIPPCHKCQARRTPGRDGTLPDVHWFTKGRRAHLPEDCTWGSSIKVLHGLTRRTDWRDTS
ncbi:hypothetical protein DPSP01_013932 [Paraphaeosphaeria sporulosa]|uniref:Gfd2/YDR514C-like C-terminal domain-containing protein n=1 Tax=Paraphaeosphaeria sporulosa TaxID=1460663 RepID=A0A177CEL3_9PLEO|nr:uncharacterized protein CC84DRAFT_1205681 [Paraphaeosphaeria sporulosa]OAG06074.1 hypothetical protein CC84DRAFT_1205681 [Paraphaeosphaeria sporulosa]